MAVEMFSEPGPMTLKRRHSICQTWGKYYFFLMRDLTIGVSVQLCGGIILFGTMWIGNSM